MTKCLHGSIDWKSRMCRDCYEIFDEEQKWVEGITWIKKGVEIVVDG